MDFSTLPMESFEASKQKKSISILICFYTIFLYVFYLFEKRKSFMCMLTFDLNGTRYIKNFKVAILLGFKIRATRVLPDPNDPKTLVSKAQLA